MSFAALGLSEALVRAVTERGYDSPTPIQAKAIPAVLSGGDLLAGAQTGTGKTAGFVLPILQRLSTTAPRRAVAGGARPIRALIMTPTRELAAQVEESVVAYAKYVKLSSTVVFGGVNINPQIDRLRRGVDILVATPGRLLDHAGQRTVDLSGVEVLVLDEADRMLDMGFLPDIRRVLRLLPAQRQNLLFSATFSDEIRALADGLLNKPAMIEVARRNAAAEGVAQRVLPVDKGRKRELLSHLIREHNWFQVLVFTRTKHGANRLAEQLTKDGIASLAIHGNKSQNARTRALAEFKSGSLQVLVATDIAARGLDIVELPHVVNFDLPNVPEDYVHRIGRTGRAGAEGEAVSLVSPDENGMLRDIERVLRREIPRETIAGFKLDPNARNEPEADDRPPRQGRRPTRGDASRGSGARHGASRGSAAPGSQAPRAARAVPSPTAQPTRAAPAAPARPAPAAPARPAGVGGFRGRSSRSGR
ncbi:MAG: DEAD/DEAH box helicase [Burkholderiales bacterium]|nr:MAG: DEAD/DEAH box helicase [Burkholderiales bacterium]RPH59447.1 MAG: DEAD/DEAH box helicase [Burkholderiales bacterium]